MKISPDFVRRAQAGDRSALARLVSDTQDPLFHFLARELGSPADAEDALQETWAQALRWLPTLRDPAAFSGWIHRIALRTARDLAVAGRTRKRVEQDASRREPIEGDGMRQAEGIERAERVQVAVAALEPDLRTAVRLRYEQGLSYEEIALATDSPTGTVGKRLHTAHDRLRQALAGAGVVLALAALERELEAGERLAAPEGVRRTLAGMVGNGSGPAAARRRGRGRAVLAAGLTLMLLSAILWRVRVAGVDRTLAGEPGPRGLARYSQGGGGTGEVLPTSPDPARVRTESSPAPENEKGRLTGKIRDAESHAPIGGAVVRIRPVGAGNRGRVDVETQTGPSGEYVIEAAPGAYYLDAWSADYAPYSVKVYVEDIVVRGRTVAKSEDDPIENEPQYAGIRAGECVVRDAELVSGRRIRGKVVDDRGFPVAGASVRALFQKVPSRSGFAAMFECEPYGVKQRVTTGVDGRFDLPPVWPRGAVWLRVECSAFKSSQPAIDLGSLGGEVTVLLEPGVPVAGTVSDSFGRPIAESLVFVADEGALLRMLPGKSDECGRFSSVAGPVGGVVLAWSPGYGPAAAGIECADAAKLDLRLPTADARVRGVVRDDRGRVVPGARIRATKFGVVVSGRTAWLAGFPDLRSASGDYLAILEDTISFPETTSAADGSFTLERLPLGPTQVVGIEVQAAGYATEYLVQKDTADMLLYLRVATK